MRTTVCIDRSGRFSTTGISRVTMLVQRPRAMGTVTPHAENTQRPRRSTQRRSVVAQCRRRQCAIGTSRQSLGLTDVQMSHRSASCGPSVMITTFQESSWGTTEIARPVGHSQMSSISVRIADSSSSRVFAGFFKLVSFTARNETTGSGYPRERFEKRREPWPSATGAILKRRAIVPESRAPPG
jgi:hypothetical protein